MPITIGSNISSLRTVRTLDRTGSDLSNVFQRLSSGQRITRASDDAAGLSISSSLNVKSQIFAQGIRNINDGISLMAIAEGALGSLSDIVTRVGELSEQAANGTFSAKQRLALDKEADTLLREYNRIIQSTSFNGMKILDGSEDVVTLQHGIGDEMVTRLEVGYQLGTAAGDGTFGAVKSFAAGDGRYTFAADFNKDGFDDVAVGPWSAWTQVFISNGNGTFVAPTSVNVGSFGINAGDFNNDGVLDLVGATYSTGAGGVALGVGDGTFRTAQQFTVGSITQDTAVLDANNDGALDLLINDGSGGRVAILIGNGNGTFRSPQTYTTAGGAWGAPATEVGDVNSDGVMDLVSFRTGTSILFGNADGTFSSRSWDGIGATIADGQLADLNGDGILDIASLYSAGGVGVLFGNGNGTFRAARTYTTGSTPTSLRIGDINGDGILDMVSSDTGVNGVSVLLGNGDGSFQARSSFSLVGSVTQRGISLGDQNGDGVLDIFGANSTGMGMILGNADSTGRRNNFVYDVDLLSIQGARKALDWTKKQQTSISRELGMLGAYQSRLRTTLSVLDTTRINSMAASSRIVDADIAAESADLVRLNILQQSGQSILAQANQSPQIALQLLRGV